jgi:hypothetical protein
MMKHGAPINEIVVGVGIVLQEHLVHLFPWLL